MATPDDQNRVIDAEVPRPPRSLWRNRDYMLLWSGQGVSGIGTAVSTIAFPLLILALTHSPVLAGLASALRAVPYVVLGLPAGALIDRWDRKRVMIVCDVGRAIVLGSIPLAMWIGHLSIIQLYFVALIEGTLFVFFSISQVSSLPHVVARSQLPAATARNTTATYTAELIGPPLGGTLFQVVGSTIPFLADAVSYAASATSLLFIKTEFQGARTAQKRRLRVEIMEGLSWLWAHPIIRTIAFVTMGFTFMGSAVELPLIVLARRQMHAPAYAIGIIFAIGGIGGILGSIVAPRVQSRFRFGYVLITAAWLVTCLLPLFTLAPNPVVLGIIASGIYVLAPIYVVSQSSYRASLIPDELRGRVNSVFRLIYMVGQPLGVGLAGVSLQIIGSRPTLLALGGFMAMVAFTATMSPHLRGARSPLAAPTV